ncbi:DUF972 family protein [Aerococcaceae bacterium DSM 111176]|nr:DUF972 family protein [Aerococcaceae bacterium DSM 111176]
MSHDLIQELIDKAESDLLHLSDTIAELRESMSHLMEQNNQLKLKNQELTDIILSKDIENDVLKEEDSILIENKPSGRDRLQAYYDDGIHICHEFFGMPITSGEECLFCNKFLEELEKRDSSKSA